jgi:C-terminal processing protease CtpA/Prc
MKKLYFIFMCLLTLAVAVSCRDNNADDDNGGTSSEYHKIGYIVYNFFSDDDGDSSMSYVRELNDVFAKFKSEGIDDLILDLRYNSGGSISTAVSLAGMISNRKHQSDVFLYYDYNADINTLFQQKYGEEAFKEYFYDYAYLFDDEGIGYPQFKINKLGLKRLYVITTGRTASASETIINGLSPYIDVVVVGERTYGKNVGSATFIDETNTDNKWGMQPIIVRLANKNKFSDYADGFSPDVEADEFSAKFRPLGDVNETMLKAALKDIGVVGGTAAEQQSPARFREFGGMVASSTDFTPIRRNAVMKNSLQTSISTTYINNWILDLMQTYYLWNDEMPTSPDKSLSPDEFFESLLSSADHFSWIMNDYTELVNMLSGITKEAGYDFNLALWEYGSDEVVGVITYIKPNTPAEAAGLQRGDVFMSVNNKKMTLSNYIDVVQDIYETHTIEILTDSEKKTVKSVTLSPVEYHENPILMDTIYYFDKTAN